MRLVIDCSVAAKWFVPEEGSEIAARLRGPSHQLLVPDLLFAEVGNVMWKRVRKGELSADDASEIASVLLRLPLRSYGSAYLLREAVSLAVEAGLTVYDSLYLSLARRIGASLVTADRKLLKLRTTELGSLILSLDELLL